MSEQSKIKDPQTGAPGESPTDGGSSGLASIERVFLRLTFWQTLLSLAGVFTGAVALYAALGESQAVRQQTAATVWPYVQFIINDHANDDEAHMALEMSNVGVGPARIRDIQIQVGGEPYVGWDALLEKFLGEAARDAEYGRSTVKRRVLAPGESLTFFQTRNRDLVLAMQSAIFQGDISLRYCYCSIFDDCWAVHIERIAGPEPMPVDVCPDYGDESFDN